MKQKYNLLLHDILLSIERIQEYIKECEYSDFKASQITIDATIRNLEIIGEAVSQIPNEIKEKYTDIPWKEIKDFRNVVIHKYRTLDLEILWDIIANRLDDLKIKIQSVKEYKK